MTVPKKRESQADGVRWCGSMAEQLICNQQVVGSIPITSSGEIPEWPKGADCKSVVTDFDGSNPSLSTKMKLIFPEQKDELFYLQRGSARNLSFFHKEAFFTCKISLNII